MSFTPRFIAKLNNFPKPHLLLPEYLKVLEGSTNGKTLNPAALRNPIVLELLAEGLLSQVVDGTTYNNVMVIDDLSSKELFRLAERHSDSIQNIIKHHRKTIQEQAHTIASLSEEPFSNHSFLILSNVLLDNWQIQSVEELYLKCDRPPRGNKRFYISLMENSLDGTDPFGIYGNIVRAVNNDFCCFYGNRQNSLTPSDFTELSEKSDVLVLSKTENVVLSNLALVIRRDLIDFFERIDWELKIYHANSLWASLTYAEFFIWWYHFLYTQVTNDLVDRGDLVLPEGGMYPYIIKAD